MVGKLILNVDIDFSTGGGDGDGDGGGGGDGDGDGDGSGMSFALKGSFGLTYPCETGEKVSGDAILTAKMPGGVSVSDMTVKVAYACGELGADTPRWSFAMSSDEGIAVGDTTLKPFTIGASVFSGTNTSGTAFAGAVSGSGFTSSGLSADVGFTFDTRDGSWEAVASVEYNSEKLNMKLALGSASACKEAGTRGSGSVSVVIGESSVKGSGSVLQRCGEWAELQGTYTLSAALEEAVITAGSAAVITLSDVTLDLVSLPGIYPASASLRDMDWRGSIAGVATLSLTKRGGEDEDSAFTAGMQLTAAMQVSWTKVGRCRLTQWNPR